MTKADLLDMLKRVPMNAEVMFVEPVESFDGVRHWDEEHELRKAFLVTGRKGLVVLLTSGGVPHEYEDVESL